MKAGFTGETVYDALTEGDRGRLTYRGTRFVGFVRTAGTRP